jgi:hypothetical protein
MYAYWNKEKHNKGAVVLVLMIKWIYKVRRSHGRRRNDIYTEFYENSLRHSRNFKAIIQCS